MYILVVIEDGCILVYIDVHFDIYILIYIYIYIYIWCECIFDAECIYICTVKLLNVYLIYILMGILISVFWYTFWWAFWYIHFHQCCHIWWKWPRIFGYFIPLMCFPYVDMHTVCHLCIWDVSVGADKLYRLTEAFCHIFQ